ncbi:glycosyltransferase family 2 protein [Roseateles paludis]|uniref:Glycosyltransferase family 2 protein n=1 Tax=Roseateles paludis TaxID=3145238 RepID=A0ABV0G004_9BURK
MSADAPFVSVVIATRDRAELFGLALKSVLAQSWADKEIIVVNDGSAAAQLPVYEKHWAEAAAQLGERFRVFHLVRRSIGHGPSYALNFGVDQAAGQYVTFLDDDDLWVDGGHLQRAATCIAAHASSAQAVDLYTSNQDAFAADGSHIGRLWLGKLEAALLSQGRKPTALGCFEVRVDEFLLADGFAHLNCLMVRRELFQQVGGLDEAVRWEGDRSLFLKLIDSAALKLHHPAVIGRHHVPNPQLKANVTTSISMVDKRLQQVIVLDRFLLHAKHASLRRYAVQHKGYALKRLAQELGQAGDWERASTYAWEALGLAPGLKWLGYCLYGSARRWYRPAAN